MSAIDSLFPDTYGAVFSPCRKYRYALWRVWNPEKPLCMFLMLNPSTADEFKNDPTVERCQRRAIQMGYGGLHVGNIFAWRSTDPDALYSLDDPIGPENDQAIVEAASKAGIVICGWGKHGNLNNRGLAILDLLRHHQITPHALTLNGDGTPGHPLYIGYEIQPAPMI